MENNAVPLPEVPSLDIITERLPAIFPDGTSHRNYLIREMAAKTIFVFFYAGAIEGTDRWVRPSQITDMTDEQANRTDEQSRESWVAMMLSNKKMKPAKPWYAANSREPVRDETIRTGLIPVQAVVVRQGIPTTSSKPTYALQKAFSELFSPRLTGKALNNAIQDWQANHLSKAAMTRLQLMKNYNSGNTQFVTINLPDGSIRTLEPGPSSKISKAVIEHFAPRFLKNPQVLWLSESGNKVGIKDDALAQSLGLNIDPSRALPDLILVDLGVKANGEDMLFLFVEVVASDGPINQMRKEALTDVATQAGFDPSQLAFMTAFLDRSAPPFKKLIADLAWDSYAWLSTEPDNIINLISPTATTKLSDLPIA
ncbi:BsuBI/PstI family type II restriction endonuclease [Alcanivorax sp. IL3]|uniref:BsuBI/PstI family type II restriction endonuclease n=1 Tax=unclassified Alcanivorax TaxID=2638842 RepID=UPI0039C14FE0